MYSLTLDKKQEVIKKAQKLFKNIKFYCHCATSKKRIGNICLKTIKTMTIYEKNSTPNQLSDFSIIFGTRKTSI